MPWLLDEDDALKNKLSGYTITNYSTGTPVAVPVFFRLPDTEEITRTFPHISIDHVGLRFAPERAHRDYEYIQPIDLEYATPPTGQFLTAPDMPLPFDIVYQITAFSRIPRDDRQLEAFLNSLFAMDFGWLDMSNYDGTIRRADLISAFKRDTIDPNRKRLYRSIVEIAVSTEIYLYQLSSVPEILTVDLDLINIDAVVPFS